MISRSESASPPAASAAFSGAPGRAVLLALFQDIGDGPAFRHPKGHRQTAHLLTNRAVERIFDRFGSVKFFLSRDYRS